MAAYVAEDGSVALGSMRLDPDMSLVDSSAGALSLYALDAPVGVDEASVYYIFARPAEAREAPAFLRRRPARLRELLIPLPCVFLRRSGEGLRPLSREDLEALLLDACDADAASVCDPSEEVLSARSLEDHGEGAAEARLAEGSDVATEDEPQTEAESDQDPRIVEEPSLYEAGADFGDE